MMDERDPVAFLVHLYQDGAFNRRELIRRVAKVTGSAATAAAAVQAMAPAARAQACPDDVRIPEGAPDLETQTVEYPGEAGTIFAYLARPRDPAPPPRARAHAGGVAVLPAVVVIHENRGLNEHIKDVTRRVARAGFVGLGVDLVSRLGGTHQFPDPVEAGRAYNRIGAAAYLEDLLSSVAYLKTLPFVRPERFGAVGFCAGGGNCFALALNSPDIVASVPFYPSPLPAAAQLDRLAGPVLMMLGQQDRFVTSPAAGLVPTLIQQQRVFGLHIYEAAQHAFLNDTGNAYNRAAACDAWAKAMEFLGRHLR